ncbi:unnamed protein product [Rhizophagus irregularis]|nr:unnamed protein product [Rhizophagus irregularis]
MTLKAPPVTWPSGKELKWCRHSIPNLKKAQPKPKTKKTPNKKKSGNTGGNNSVSNQSKKKDKQQSSTKASKNNNELKNPTIQKKAKKSSKNGVGGNKVNKEQNYFIFYFYFEPDSLERGFTPVDPLFLPSAYGPTLHGEVSSRELHSLTEGEQDTNRLQQNTRQLQANAQNQLVIRQRDQNILNLQGQILALQNNPPNIQHIGMAGYPPPKFHGLAGKDPADYIRDLHQWCEVFPNHDLNAGHQHQIHIDRLFESVIILVLQILVYWYYQWNNTLHAINANQFRGGALHTRNTVPANNNAIANLIVPGHTIWEENWSISGGCPILLAPNAPNANAGTDHLAMALTISKERTIWPRLLGDFKGTDHLAMAPRRFQRWVGLRNIVFSSNFV